MTRTDLNWDMHPGPGWIHRDELLKRLRKQKLSVSTHQLLRWHNRGLLPQPRRVGRGRSRGGSDSYYPWWTVLQVAELREQLKEQRRQNQLRSLADAGWALWVVGFPVTLFARKLLLSELREGRRLLRGERRRYSTRQRSPSLDRLARSRSSHLAKSMRKAVRPEQLSGVFQMITDMQLGTLDPDEYSEEQWQFFQDAVIASISPDLLDAEDLPAPSVVATDISRLAATRNIPQVIRALKAIDETLLCLFRDEAQTLVSQLASAVGKHNARMSREAFLQYFKVRYVDKEAAKETVQLLKVLGWTKPPLSPLAQLFRGAASQE